MMHFQATLYLLFKLLTSIACYICVIFFLQFHFHFIQLSIIRYQMQHLFMRIKKWISNALFMYSMVNSHSSKTRIMNDSLHLSWT